LSWLFDAAPRTVVRGRFWRMLAPRWSHAPLSGAGAARAGGRWNEAGQPALYLSADHATAIAEYQQDLPRPGTLTAYDVDASAILNLDDAGVTRVLGLDPGFLRLPWKRTRDIEHGRPPTWDFAAAAYAAGLQGMLVRSVQGRGINVVLWAWNDPTRSSGDSLV
jgi:RES domain-containing protein